ncbi:dihydrodipicolinate synthase [Mangrovimonas yunxiaonensis]|uniref:4-hydroxy-tetrahydrodipicolinate synthase n=1 Tax=Mangrovimonas yunxiaonensis TaxID=1197477 RepID=A0A084TN61_9FLAO|nr:4-hydroxy-tetrahydrodipicolinate synthase [Mangrovimonas yunxiaonensis]KFB02147.1 dihydrodipicolinate synthase [Mangrovimonas yunxiaonensis]
MNNKFQGTGVALVTPFKEDLSVDFEALSKLVEYNIENGTNYLVVSGTTGESATITKAEKKAILETVVKTNNKRLPVVLGIGGNNTAAVIEEINNTNLNEVDALLSVSPYYSKPTQEGIYQHFKAIALASPKPIILYNVPGRTASNMLPETTLRLARDFENIIAVKEAGNNISQYLELIKNKPEDFAIISGDDDLALGVALAGGAGVISVIGQAFPKEFSKMIQLGLQDNVQEAYKIHFKLMDVIGYIFSENNPAGIKAVLAEKGLCKPEVRLPLVQATNALKKQIASYIKTF